ncbi:MAG: sulfatase [Gemmataceae bacterium]|nr:sulfatase [Gemmataceae bacterium]
MRWIFTLALAALAAGAMAATPNVVFIVSDDQAWTDYSFMGHAQIRTPNLDKLAKQSLVFRRGYVPSSLCCPSLASLLTGKYPHQTKITGNEPPAPEGKGMQARYRNPDFLKEVNRLNGFITQHPRLPAELGKAGYVSFQSGKWWAGSFRSGGFTEGMSHGDQAQGGRHGDDGLKIGRQGLQPIFDFLDRAGRKPFFLWYAPMLPHNPHTPPERLLAKYKNKTPSIHVARYWAMVEWFDETCGQLLEYLDKKGLAENTLVVYVTDNGWIQREDNPAYRADSKQSPYDGGLRTPIMLRLPGKISPGIEDTPVSSIDLAPTVYKLCSVPVPDGLPGVDLLNSQAIKGRKAVFGSCFLHNAINIDKPGENLAWRWCVSGEWKLIIPHKNARDGVKIPGKAGVELYRIASDPSEEKNLAGQEGATVGRLKKLIDDWWPGS